MRISSFFAALIGSVLVSASVPPLPRQTCPEAARFGVLQVVPSELKPGDWYTLHVDFECAASKGIKPKYLDFYLEVPSGINNGHQPPILIARRDYELPDSGSKSLTFTAQIPEYSGFFSGSTYVVTLRNHHAASTTNNETIYLVGGTQLFINLTT